MPNTIHGEDASNRDTSDAPLWYGVVCEEIAADRSENIYDSAGRQGRAGTSRTCCGNRAPATPTARPTASAWTPPRPWSGVRPISPGWTPIIPACTPREGYPVEIQVLWIRLLRQLERLGARPAGEPWRVLADRAEDSLRNFSGWRSRVTWPTCSSPNPANPPPHAVADDALRSNYLLAIAFGFVTGAPARRAVAAALRYLFVPGALRSLAPLPVSAAAGNSAGRRPASERPARAVLGPLRGRRRHPAQTRLSQRHRLDWTLPVVLRSAGPGLGSVARRRRRRPGVSGRHGPSHGRRLPGPDAGNSGRRRPPSAARLRRPGLERDGGVAGLEIGWGVGETHQNSTAR